MDTTDWLLVVDDDEVLASFLSENLTADGYRVATASGASEGLRAMEVRRPQLVILDLVLEDGSGLALLDRVRSSDGLSSRIDPDVPVIVLSGRSGDADRVRQRSLVLYSPATAVAARTLAAEFGFELAKDSRPGWLTVLLGKDAITRSRRRS